VPGVVMEVGALGLVVVVVGEVDGADRPPLPLSSRPEHPAEAGPAVGPVVELVGLMVAARRKPETGLPTCAPTATGGGRAARQDSAVWVGDASRGAGAPADAAG